MGPSKDFVQSSVPFLYVNSVQVFILDALAQYDASPKEAESIAERVTPRLQHANAAVVMSAIKVTSVYSISSNLRGWLPNRNKRCLNSALVLCRL